MDLDIFNNVDIINCINDPGLISKEEIKFNYGTKENIDLVNMNPFFIKALVYRAQIS